MRPAAFDYAAPTSLQEAIELLGETPGEAHILAGGQSLIPAMTLRMARPGKLIDLRRVPDLGDISVEKDSISIGAMVTHAQVARSESLRPEMPVLARIANHIAHPAIRTRGTFCGSLAHADPASEWPTTLLALGGSVTAVSRRGSRVIEAADLFESLLTTSLDDDEIIVSASLPRRGSSWRWSFQEAARQSGAFALALVVAGADLAEDNSVRQIRLAIGGCDLTPISPDTEWSFMSGRRASPDDIDQAAQQAAAVLQPPSDHNASAEDRRHIAKVLVRRALTDVLAPAAESGPQQ